MFFSIGMPRGFVFNGSLVLGMPPNALRVDAHPQDLVGVLIVEFKHLIISKRINIARCSFSH